MQENNKRIAKNTLIMYIRMLLVMAITLITVRFVIKTLGIEDYGIYNVVAGLVVSMSVVSSSMQMATQRFYAYSIGEHDNRKLQTTFNTSLFIYLIIVIIIALLAETAGLWFLYNKMTIPETRFTAALWIYHFATASFMITMLATPFSAMIIAREDMGVYAFVSLTDCVLKLLILVPVFFLSCDKLIMYGIFIFAVTLIKESINFFYSRQHYPECKWIKVWDKKLFQSILSYSGWSLFGTGANIAYNQGNNILINLFFGPIANAAQAVAFQVSTALSMFSSNFFAVIRPPLIKSYADKNYQYMMRLFYTSAKITFCLLLLIFLPLILNTEYILNLWLDNVGDYMVKFTQLTLIATIILAMHQPVTTLIQATGAVKRYHVIVETSTLLILPLTYLCFKTGYSAMWAFYISIAMFVIAHIIRLLVLRTVISFSLREYSVKFVLPMLSVSVISISVISYLHHLQDNGFLNLVFTCLFSILLVSGCSWWLAFSRTERIQVLKMIKNRG